MHLGVRIGVTTSAGVPVALIVLALSGILLLTGCGPGPLKEGNKVSPTEAHESVYTALSDAITFFNLPDTWTPPYGNPPDDCAVNGHPGVSFVEIQQGPGPGSEQARDALAKNLVTHLEKQGYSAYTAERNPTDPVLRVYANSGAVEKFHAYIAPDFISIQAVSWCVTGTDPDTSTPPAPTPTGAP